MLSMESAKDLATLRTQYTKMSDVEYDQLDNITGYWHSKDTKVPGNKQIDASFIKTPFCEESPVPSKVGGPNHFGLIIACDGYSMGRGLLEFW